MHKGLPTACGLVLPVHEALRIEEWRPDGYRATFHDLRFIVSAQKEKDDKIWVHGSVSRRDRKTPSYADLLTMRKYVYPENATVYQVFPPKDEYFSQAFKGQVDVLHLWSCPDGRFTPDFRGPEGMI